MVVSANDNVVPATFYVVTAWSPSLGLDLIRLLNLDTVSGKVKHIDNECEISPAPSQTTEHSTSPVYTVSPVSATHLGCVKGFVHKVQVNSTVTPACHKLRRLPCLQKNDAPKGAGRCIELLRQHYSVW